MRKKGLIIVIGLFLMVSLSAGYSLAADKDTVTIAIAAAMTQALNWESRWLATGFPRIYSNGASAKVTW
ncbi:MAG: hypothetical protein JRI95_13250 [Deltaproteobacteria bacterium]|nr:hypothetical protein [Deltaproteobacteria bacterium]MBW2086874.1 hypothetical protein [Deltaproteobacteria bacterium]